MVFGDAKVKKDYERGKISMLSVSKVAAPLSLNPLALFSQLRSRIKSEDNMNSIPVRVCKVCIDGIDRTKDDYIRHCVDDVFKANNFQQLIEKSIETRLKLEKLHCFKDISILIDTNKNGANDCGYDIMFCVKELGRIHAQINTSIENNQPSVSLIGQLPNLMGRGEQFRTKFEHNFKRMQTFDMSFFKPFTPNVLSTDGGFLATSIFKRITENVAGGFKCAEYGTLASLSFLYNSKFSHSMEFETVIRNLSLCNRDVSFAIREHCGYSLKSSLKNSFSLDNRNSKIFPTKGACLYVKTELAGTMGGDTGFLKNELFAQLNVPLLMKWDIHAQLSLDAGVISGIRADKSLSLVDHFFMGGPLTMRGFQFNGIGEKSDGYVLGGSMYWMSALHLYTHFPFLRFPKKGSFGDNFRLHFFCNAGNIVGVGNMNGPSSNGAFEKLCKNIRLAYGLGLVYKFGEGVRVELNYCLPALHQSDDKIIDGVQLGIGFHFL